MDYTPEQYRDAGFPEGRTAAEATWGPGYVARKMEAKYSQPHHVPAPFVQPEPLVDVIENPITVPYLDEVAAGHAAWMSQPAPPKKPVESVKLRTTDLFDEALFRKHIPAEMMSEKRWVRYFLKPKGDGAFAKIPLGARLGEAGSHSDESSWGTFSECVKNLENDQQGIGYCLTGGVIHCLDVDHCCKKGGIPCNEAMLLLSRLRSWSEYSVSGQGIHVFFKGNVRGHQLKETCLQYWNPKKEPRFIALTCNMVGPAFTTLRDIGDDFNLVFATAAHTSAKIREELKGVDYEQWAKLPEERERTEVVTREKSKTKTRKVVEGFDIKDFLKFYNIPIGNETDNEIGHCLRVATCPIKGEPHVGHNNTTCNFIYPCKDGGLAFHCQSTGCVDSSIGDVIKKLAEDHGPYPNKIYEEKQNSTGRVRKYKLEAVTQEEMEHPVWLWEGYLQANQLTHHAGNSGQGKSPVSRDLIARVSSGAPWPDGKPNTFEKRMVLVLASEDDWNTVITPHLVLAGANLDNIKRFKMTTVEGDTVSEAITALDRDIAQLEECLKDYKDQVGMIVIDPITNYLGKCSMNKEDEVRGLLMPLAELAQRHIVSINTLGHLNKDTNKLLLDRVMGAAAFKGVARQTLFYVQDEESESEFAHVLGFGRKTTTPGMRYVTEERALEIKGRPSKIVCVKWCGTSKLDIEDALITPSKLSDRSASKQVQLLMKSMLRDGFKSSTAVEEAIKREGIELVNWQKAARKVAKSGKNNNIWGWELKVEKQSEFDLNKEEEAAA